MSIFNYKKIINHTYIILIVLFSFLINWHYSKYGVFPIDSFLHYDSAYRILNGEYPIKDFWVVSGIFVDYLQALFFKILGVNWYSYIFHSSLMNVLISTLTFSTLVKFNLKKKFAFFYSICFAVLAYPVSGTPFVDLHATFFSVGALYFTLLAIKKPEEYLNWFLLVTFYFFAFFSKQVPTTYIILSNIVIIFPYLLIDKKFKPLLIIFLSLLFYLLIFLVLLRILGIEFNNFYIQYIDYPRTIGSSRLNFFKFSIVSFISHYKFILIPLFFLLFIKTNQIIKNKIKFYSSEYVNFLIYFVLCLTLFLNQLLTRNQIYIYFLIPLTFAFLQIEIEKLNLKYRNIFNYLIIFIVIFSTIKYHIRYNENRKFHELSKTDISKNIEATALHESLKGILWISPFYKGDAQEEIEMLKKVKFQLDKKKNIMLVSHYLFLDSITLTNLNSPSKTHTIDGASIPMNNSKYFNYYKNFLYAKFKKKKIKEVYFIKSENMSHAVFPNFFQADCYVKIEKDIFFIYKIKNNCLN